MSLIAAMIFLGLMIELFFVCDVMVHRHRRNIRD